MFPLAHNYLAEKLLQNPEYTLGKQITPFQTKLLRVGSVLPDLVAGMGMERNFGHLMGEALYGFCRENQEKYPDAWALALGVWLHGADPCGFDYYADEHWQDAKGWCFQKCTPYIFDVVKACNLPAEWGLWKAHNFVEMMAEIECDAVVPSLGKNLLAAALDREVVNLTEDLLSEFGGAQRQKVQPVLQMMDEMFSVENVTPLDLGEKYALQLVRRHDIHGADPEMIADIIEQIGKDLRHEFWLWYAEAEKLILQEISAKIPGLKTE